MKRYAQINEDNVCINEFTSLRPLAGVIEVSESVLGKKLDGGQWVDAPVLRLAVINDGTVESIREDIFRAPGEVVVAEGVQVGDAHG